nr:energy-coupling factor transporter ATPase [Microbacterium pseudoresistens]
MIRVRDLSLTHAGSGNPSPRGISVEIAAGEVVLLLGPSGSGKSTLTLALNGLIPHAVPATVDGSVGITGLDTADTPVARLSTEVSMVFQDPDAQLVTGTVLDEVAFALENLRMPVAEVLARSEAALRRMGLWERRDENPDRLSGGGRQRLAIAAALATGSRVLVLDEPTANLDPDGIDDVYDALGDVATDAARAIVLVEHALDPALAIATRVLVLDRAGRLAFDGTPEEVLRGHADELTALGVWLPTAALLARRLRERGVPVEPLPLTAGELQVALADAVTDVPTPAPDAAAEPASEPIVRVRGLTVARRKTTILHDIDLDIPAGSITAVVGANGAGKTTLVQAIAGVVPPPRGHVQVAGLDPATASPRELTARIGFVFQNPEHQFIAPTVFEDLAHGLRLRHSPADEIDEKVGAMLGRFGLEHKAAVHPFLLSGGEKRRLSVGTALITRPEVLVLDEPTFGQDHARATELLDLVQQLRAEGTTIVLVTHDMRIVAEHASHVVVLTGGRIRAAGRTADVLREGAGLRLPDALRAVPPALRPLLQERVR